MKRANEHRGRIEEHAKGLGTADESMVAARAGEIAQTNGRKPEEATPADYDQARQELEANQRGVPPNQTQDTIYREGPIVSSGRAARVKQPTDEQDESARLVQEGVDEATHEQMVQGNEQSRQRDKLFEDQLPGS